MSAPAPAEADAPAVTEDPPAAAVEEEAPQEPPAEASQEPEEAPPQAKPLENGPKTNKELIAIINAGNKSLLSKITGVKTSADRVKELEEQIRQLTAKIENVKPFVKDSLDTSGRKWDYETKSAIEEFLEAEQTPPPPDPTAAAAPATDKAPPADTDAAEEPPAEDELPLYEKPRVKTAIGPALAEMDNPVDSIKGLFDSVFVAVTTPRSKLAKAAEEEETTTFAGVTFTYDEEKI